MSFSYIDICIAIIVVLLGIRGMWRGFVKGFLGFLGLLIGLFLASRLCDKSGELFADVIYDFQSPKLNTLIGFVIVLFVVWVLSLIVSEILSKIIHIASLGFVDRILGIIFEAGKTFLIIAVIVFGIGQIDALSSFYNKIKKDSVLYPLMNTLSNGVMNLKVKTESSIDTDTIKNRIDKASKSLQSQQTKENIQNTIKQGSQEIQKQVENILK